MIDTLNFLARLKCEVHVMYMSNIGWSIHLKTCQNGANLEVRELGKAGEPVEDVFNRACTKFLRITDRAPELLPLQIAAPVVEYTPFKDSTPGGVNSLDDEISF